MKHRLLTTLSSVVIVGAVGTGVSLAGDHYHAGSAPESKPSQRSQPPSGFTPSKQSFSAYLTGENEVEEEGKPAGDPGAKGTAVLQAVNRRQVCYGFTMRGLSDAPTVVHVHKGKAGQNGPVVITFANPPKGDAPEAPGASAGCKKLTEQGEIDVLHRITKNPKNYYVNVHTEPLPGGAARGQLSFLLFNNQP